MKHNIYFAELEPFRGVFRGGIPILCYHKVARKPRRAVFRSIYINPGLFASQMRQLRSAGFRSATLGEVMSTRSEAAAVLTFDDGSLSVWRNALGSLADCGFKAINYLVSDRIGGINDWDTAKGEIPDALMDDAHVREWMAAGHEIGAHTRTHPRLSRIPLKQAREEIFGSKKSLEDRFGVPIRHFCYPYGDCSPGVRDLVQEAGYATAVTLVPGVCRAGADPLLLPRLGARAHSLNFRNLFTRLLGRPLVDVSSLLEWPCSPRIA